MALQHLRSSTANKRPTPAVMADGQLAMNTETTSPGLFFKNSGGTLVKIGPVHVGTTAPNATPGTGGEAGNSVGEQWLDTSSGRFVFKIWDGTAFRSEDGEFVNASGDTMTGALGIIAGSAESPSLFISGDTNTGIYSPAADTFAITTAGSNRLHVTSGGLVGIGSSVPRSLLDCKNTHAYGTAAQDVIRITPNFNGGSPASASSIGAVTWGYDDGTTNLGRINVIANQPSATNASSMQFWIHNGSSLIQQAVFNSTGFGIGTTDPVERLTVVGGCVHVTGNLSSLNRPSSSVMDFFSGVTRFLSIGADASTHGQIIFETSTTTNNLERVRVDSSGRLLVGTSTTTGARLVNYKSEGVGTYFGYNNDGTFPKVSALGFGSDAVSFTHTSGGSTFVLQGSAQIAALQSASSGAFTDLAFYTTASGVVTERLRIQSAGELVLAGSTAQKATGTTWSNPSDMRIKDNIRDYSKGIAELMQVRVREWEYNGKGGTAIGTKGLGVVADEAMLVLPDTVDTYEAKLNTDDEETTSIKKFDATEITWLLVKTVQEQQALIKILEQRLTDAGIA